MITRVAIRNFKSFQRAEIELSSLNILTGLNGMGKSSLIQSLLLLRQSSANFIPEIKGLILKGEDDIIVDVGKGKDAFSMYADSDFINFQIDIDNQRFLDISYNYDAESDVLLFKKDYKDFYTGSGNPSLFNNNFKYLKADRLNPAQNYKANLSAVIRSEFLGYKGENTPLFIALKKLEPLKIENLIHEQATANNLLSNLDAWMSEITPGAHIISTYYNEIDIVKLGYQFTIGNDVTPEFSPLNVGFGITYTLPIITAVLASKPGDLLIIENPETHLHPRGQAKLALLLAIAANEGVQIIIETHSDHIINGVLVACKRFENNLKGINKDFVKLYHFSRDTETHTSKIKSVKVLFGGKIDEQPNDFFDQTDKDLNYLLGF